MKKIVHALHKQERQVNREKWKDYKKNGCLSAANRRMLMASWLNECWKFMKAERAGLLHGAFDNTVFIRLDGSHSLSLIGLEGYVPPPVCRTGL